MKFIILILFLFSHVSFAGNDEPHPIIDSNYVSKYLYNTKDLSTKDLKKVKLLLEINLKEIGKLEFVTKKELDGKLLNSLLKYDDIRIKITDVIDELIEEYQVNDDIRNSLLTFKETFKEIIKENRPLVKSLRDYKAYDFRLGSAYLAMMTAFHSREDTKKFYFQLVKDKKNNSTSIGRYNSDLVNEQEQIIKLKLDIERQLEANDIIEKLKEVDKEILSRN